MSAEGFQAWGDRRRQRSAEVRHVKAEERAVQIRAYKQEYPDVTREELSVIFDVSEFTLKGLSLGMAETRKQARQTKAVSRAEVIRAYKAEHPELSNRAIAKVLGFDEKTIRLTLRNL
jgi:predicted HTH transcriptional regulator